MEKLKKDDYFKYDKPKNIMKLYGQILEEDNKYYKFIVLACNRPGLLNRTGSFLKDGKISKFIIKVNKEDLKYGLLK